jgi:hypothetical protein
MVNYNEKQIENLPDTFRVELPITIDSVSNYFSLSACVNDSVNESFIIDTKMNTSSYKTEDIQKLNPHFWGKRPLNVTNSSGQQYKPNLYYFDKFSINELNLGNPLFSGIDTANTTYNIMYKNVIGTNILELLNWKFDLDNNKLILFGFKDNQLLENEIEGFDLIKNGLDYDKIKILFPKIKKVGNFTLDLGCGDEILVNKNMFRLLKQTHPYRKIIGVKKTLYLFENVDIQWGSIQIPNCQVFYNSAFPKNIIGARLIKRFNFILNYRNQNTKYLSLNNLYIKPKVNFEKIDYIPAISDFGFIVDKRGDKYFVSYLEENGIADKLGIKLQDEIVCIEKQFFDFSNQKLLIKFLLHKKQITIEIVRNGTTKEFNLIQN